MDSLYYPQKLKKLGDHHSVNTPNLDQILPFFTQILSTGY